MSLKISSLVLATLAATVTPVAAQYLIFYENRVPVKHDYFSDDFPVLVVLAVLLGLAFLFVQWVADQNDSSRYGSSDCYEQSPQVSTQVQALTSQFDSSWYREEKARMEDEIAYLVKQAELEETREWLAKRSKK